MTASLPDASTRTFAETVSATLSRAGVHTPDQTIRPETLAPGPALAPDSRPPGPALVGLTVGPDGDAHGADLEVTEVLGEGGMGVVELALQQSLQREVAIKRVKAEPRHAAQVDALLREARTTGALEHPNIVPVHALGSSPALGPMMVMKRIEGVSWADVIDDPAHPHWDGLRADRLVRHVEITIQIAHALEYAHSRGVVHRDVKPANVVIGRFGEVVLLDWGVAVRLDEVGALAADAIAGTPHYMCIELLSPDTGRVGTRSDVYLLAGSLRHALTGREPHGGETLLQVLASVARNQLPELPDEVDAELTAIVDRAMARDPEERFASVRELRVALEDFLRHRASARLADVALARLDAMDEVLVSEAAAPVEVREHFDAARFGFEQALVGWPRSELAREGLTRAFETMVRRELARGDLDSAVALNAALEKHDAQKAARLAEDVDARARELAKSREEETRLRDVGHEHDARVSRRERRLALLALVVLATVGTGLLTVMALADPPPPVELLPVPPAVAFVLIASVVAWQREKFLQNRINRILTTHVLVLFASVVLNRVHAALTAQTLEAVLSRDALLVATVAAVSGVVLHRRFFAIAAIYAAAALLGGLWPDAAVFAVIVAGLPALVIIALGLREAPPTAY